MRKIPTCPYEVVQNDVNADEIAPCDKVLSNGSDFCIVLTTYMVTGGYTIVGYGNTGKISATSEVTDPSAGGVLGYAGHKNKSSKSLLVSCYNSGSVSAVTTKAAANASGIAGMSNGTVTSPLSPVRFCKTA